MWSYYILKGALTLKLNSKKDRTREKSNVETFVHLLSKAYVEDRSLNVIMVPKFIGEMFKVCKILRFDVDLMMMTNEE